ncbi:hypothetical protein [Bacillus cereus]|uniref:hypothetical protein n=1 Tax=Bacillus cereus TaxID=1396 RepID=UPI0005DBE539|nr:hypothetical protein [Bacillus cereus]MDA2512666.1 hypothetical protein [Bacillus cereus]MDF9488753.1 hypothetical protein [Bacillus cereus]COF59720.1 Uncharacterised protein [Streptococcus pneumoniae]
MYCVGFIPFNFVLASVKVPVYRTNDNGTLERVGTNVEGWVHGHCIDSNQKIQDEIDSVRASLAEIRGSGGTKGTGDIDNPIRTYRGVELQNIDPVYIADQRTVVEMTFVGKGEKYTNAEGWRRDLKYFWSELLDRHPEAFSPNNRAIIEGRNPFTDSPVNDKVFREYFSQYDVKGVRGDKLVHHHIGGGGQAFPVPQKLHPGSGGIHNIEKEAGIWGKDKIYSELLQKLIKE